MAIDDWLRTKFCSERCMQASRVPAPKFCPSCGVEFRPKQGKSRPQTFCSLSCAMAARGVNPRMEDRIGRRLRPDEIVHHKDEEKLNNQPSNFELMTAADHGRLHNPPQKPVTTDCAICGTTFTPHKTKRGRTRTCSTDCKGALLRLRWQERRARSS